MADATIKVRGGDSNATQLQSRDIDATAPTDTQVLTWSSGDSEWEPAAAGGGGGGDSNTDFDAGYGLTLGGDDSMLHGVLTNNLAGGTGDDIRINSKESFILNLDSNDNQTSVADFIVAKHGSTGTIATADHLFQVNGETGAVTCGAMPATPNTAQLQVVGPAALEETTAPSAYTGFGALYVKSSDNKIYFKASGGTEYDLTATGSGGGDWLDALGNGASLDGIGSLAAQSSAPSATADYAKLYSFDAPDGKTVGLWHFDGADASTTMTNDGTGADGVAVSDAELSTTLPKIGTASLILDGVTGNRVTVADSTDWDWAGEFTVEAWVKFNSTGSWMYIINSAAAGSYFRIAWKGTNNTWAISTFTSNAYYADTLSTGVWYHVAMTRDSSDNVRFYRDGVLKGTDSSGTSGTIGNNSGLTIGAYAHLALGGGGQVFDGYIDELRILKGEAAYTGTGSFTPPTTAFSATAAEMYVLDEAGNATKISPHRNGVWEYYSSNQKTGKTVRINMDKSMRLLEKLSGEKLIEE